MATEKAFVDTNLFLRYLTNDVPEQADCIEELFQRAALGEVILVWQQLSTVYSFDRKHFSRFENITVKVPGE